MGQSASFTPRTLTLGAMSTGVKQSNSGWNSQCDRHVRRRLSLINQPLIDRASPAGRVDLVCLVYLVYLVHRPGERNEPNKPEKPDRPDRLNNGLLSLADLFSILLMVQFVSHSAQ